MFKAIKYAVKLRGDEAQVQDVWIEEFVVNTREVFDVDRTKGVNQKIFKGFLRWITSEKGSRISYSVFDIPRHKNGSRSVQAILSSVFDIPRHKNGSRTVQAILSLSLPDGIYLVAEINSNDVRHCFVMIANDGSKFQAENGERSVWRSMGQVADFWNRGFTIVESFLDDNEVGRLKAAASSMTFTPIFLQARSNQIDSKRLMTSIPSSGTLTAITVKMEEQASQFTNECEVSSWTMLKSLPGGATQQVHRDFPSFETAWALCTDKWVQGYHILANMPPPKTRATVKDRKATKVAKAKKKVPRRSKCKKVFARNWCL
ncbi:hypothetical protein ATCC90586_000835 [Pythium insidiosum]|nr:hypothetical protein ATCC90586_000835 [Pythium insidiosum]